MRLGEHITITIDNVRFTLHPSLRAAVLLERRHGLDVLPGKILDGHATAVADTIAACDGSRTSAEVLELLAPVGMFVRLALITEALVELCLGLVGFDPDAEPKADSQAEPQTVAQAQRHLYRIATGVLGWPPAAAWEATPLEILEAWNGRLEFMRQTSGIDTDKPVDRAATADERFTAGIRALGTTKMRRPA